MSRCLSLILLAACTACASNGDGRGANDGEAHDGGPRDNSQQPTQSGSGGTQAGSGGRGSNTSTGFGNRDAGPPEQTGDAGFEVDETCARVSLETHRVVPRLHLMIDASNSMTLPIEGDVSRWDALGDALFDADDGVIAQLESVVAFGMTIYYDAFGMCPLTKDWAPALNQADVLHDGFVAIGSPPGERTPTLEALTGTREFVLEHIDDLDATEAADGPTLIALATDGIPYGCTTADATECQSLPEDEIIACVEDKDEAQRDMQRDQAIAAAHDNFSAGLPTFVISLAGEAPLIDSLQRMANRGQGLDEDAEPGARLFVPSNLDALREMLLDLVGRGGSCRVTLTTGEFIVAAACTGEVTLDGNAVPCDDPDGWRAIDGRHIELLGDACQRWLDSSSSQLRADFPCSVVHVD